MASSDCVVTLTVDDELGKLLAEVLPLCKSMEKEIERQRQEIRDLHMRVDKCNAYIAEVRDGLDAWAGRIQRLENLPGVAEALAAADNDK